MKSAEEIREHFLDLLNHALPRLGLYGGETAAQHFLSELAFIDQRDAEFQNHLDALRARGAFTHLGVAGAFTRNTGLPATDSEIGSVYAEVAFEMGYLKTHRVLDANEFDSLRLGLRKSCRARDFTTEDVVATCGIPSWMAGTNPFYPCVYLYICADRQNGTIAFDFWNVVQYDTYREKTCGSFGDLPVLRNVRIRGRTFGREFTFTPLGRKIANRD